MQISIGITISDLGGQEIDRYLAYFCDAFPETKVLAKSVSVFGKELVHLAVDIERLDAIDEYDWSMAIGVLSEIKLTKESMLMGSNIDIELRLAMSETETSQGFMVTPELLRLFGEAGDTCGFSFGLQLI